MIKFKATLNARVLVTMCLERKNIEKLLEGKPIRVYGEDLEVPFDIVIMFGEDKAAIIDDLRRMGVVLPPEDTWKIASGPPKATH